VWVGQHCAPCRISRKVVDKRIAIGELHISDIFAATDGELMTDAATVFGPFRTVAPCGKESPIKFPISRVSPFLRLFAF
jgi:hypothetical protein